MEASIAQSDLRDLTRLFAERTRGDVGGAIAEILALAGRDDVISFAGGLPDATTFPRDELAAIFTELDARAFQYAPTEGLATTRDFLRTWIGKGQGAAPEPTELLVTSGGMEALELISKAIVEDGDVVAVEGPTYVGGIMAFRAFGASVVALRIDDGGLDVAELESALRGGLRPKLLYTIPEHQNPAGVSLAAERRAPLVELARRHGFLIVEDVAYRELGFAAAPAPSLWSIAPDVVVQVGTFSKTFMPGTRLGWACGPREVIAQLVWAKQTTDQCASPLAQRLLEEYGRRGLLDAGIERARTVYARRWRALNAAFERSMPDGVEWTRPSGGFFTWVTLPDGDAAQLARVAIDRGVAYVAGEFFFPDGRGRRNARVSFSVVDEGEIDEGVARLAAVFA
ncbi:MAG TPA: PLP-dependent aminotransferase family protein [Gaiellaceae bacterium]|nr:PLP-dependent aminotransferase family protein [Gaiellaceae bacterium]